MNMKFLPLLALSLSGCGSVMTRPFQPLSEPPEAAKEAAFAEAFQVCVKQVTGVDAIIYDGRATSTGPNAGAVVGGTYVGSAVVASTVSGTSGALAGLGAITIALPIALGYGAMRGISVANRNHKEGEIQDKVTACMKEKNYKIIGWRLVKKGETSDMSTPVAKPKDLE